MMNLEATPFLDIRCGLSESPIWEEDENVLRFVDIVKKHVYRVDLSKPDASPQRHEYQDAVCVTGDIASSPSQFIFGGKYGVGLGEKNSNKTTILHEYWSPEEKEDDKPRRMRANDGAVDSQGRFWINTLCDPEVVDDQTADGALFRLESTGQLTRVLEGFTVPNGMSWSLDNKTMYITDTQEASIFAYSYDEVTGNISNKREFFKTEGAGGPDGHAQDEHGNLWVALWGQWRVVCINLEGEITAEIAVPTRCPTAVAFAGEDVFITSEEEHEPDKYPDSLKHHGAVFKCRVGRKGKQLNKAQIK